MPRDYHVFAWEDEPSDERPSEFMRSTGYGGLHTTTQHGNLTSYGSSQYGGFAPSTQIGPDSMGESGFTRPSPLPHERLRTRPRFSEVPIAIVLTTIFGGVAYLLYEFSRIVQR